MRNGVLIYLILLSASILFSSYQGVFKIRKTKPDFDKIYATIGGVDSAFADSDNIVQSKAVILKSGVLDSFELAKYQVTSYTIAIARRKGMAFICNAEGTKLIPVVLEEFKSVSPGDFVLLANVKVKYNDQDSSVLRGMTYIVPKLVNSYAH